MLKKPEERMTRQELHNGGEMIKAFATVHRLKTVREGEGEDIEYVIPGRLGISSIYEWAPTELAVSFIPDGRKAPRTGLWNTFKAACISAGMIPRQIGDAEGTFSFSPINKTQAMVAIKGIKTRVKRQMSPEQAQAGAARLARHRFEAKTPKQEASVSS